MQGISKYEKIGEIICLLIIHRITTLLLHEHIFERELLALLFVIAITYGIHHFTSVFAVSIKSTKSRYRDHDVISAFVEQPSRYASGLSRKFCKLYSILSGGSYWLNELKVGERSGRRTNVIAESWEVRTQHLWRLATGFPVFTELFSIVRLWVESREKKYTNSYALLLFYRILLMLIEMEPERKAKVIVLLNEQMLLRSHKLA